jgi:electron transfer flavoprotein beta subunit
VLNVGGVESEPTIRKALAIGADKAIRINAEPIDALMVAKEIAAAAQQGNYDMILMGRESIDYNGGIVHGLVGELLNIPSVSPVMTLDLEGNSALMDVEIDGGKQKVKVEMPFVAGCQEPIAEWKIPNMRGIMTARTKPLEVLEPAASEKGTKLIKHQLPDPKTGCKMVPADQVEQLVDLLRNEAKVF